MSFEFLKSPIHLVGYPGIFFLGFTIAFFVCTNLPDGTSNIEAIAWAFGATLAVSGLLFVLDRELDRKNDRKNPSENDD